ncbi:MAG: hypothetical protein DRG83_19820 [Deltaproteobacteria bacterium]|nr:MAG: hypothetical protein DRG83_19820 [Deltaproteobacteria bacterium]
MDLELVELYKKTFETTVKKHLVIDEGKEAVFNPGVYKGSKYYVYARTSTHHVNYTSWIRLYESSDGLNFRLVKDFFMYPPYTVKEYIYGFEDDRCVNFKNLWVHTHSTLLAKNVEQPTRKEYVDFIGVSIGKKADEATFVGIVDIPGSKNSSLVGNIPWLIHRPLSWTDTPVIWYGKFSEGFQEALDNLNLIEKNGYPLEELIRLSPPKENRILLVPLKSWRAFKIGLGAPPISIGDNRYLFTFHVRSIPYQYWIGAGILVEDEEKLHLEKLLPFPICIPNTPWELIGDVPKVCFICGATISNGNFEGWYGAADTKVMKFEVKLDYLISVIEKFGIKEAELKSETEALVRKNLEKLRKNILVDRIWLNNTLSD